MKKVKRYRIDAPGTYSGVVGYTDVMIATRRGRFNLKVEHAPGSPEWPMTETDRDEKFLDCAGRVVVTMNDYALKQLGLMDGEGQSTESSNDMRRRVEDFVYDCFDPDCAGEPVCAMARM